MRTYELLVHYYQKGRPTSEGTVVKMEIDADTARELAKQAGIKTLSKIGTRNWYTVDKHDERGMIVHSSITAYNH